MASITTRGRGGGEGSRIVTFTLGDKVRKTIILGKVSMKVAAEIRRRVEYLVAARIGGVAVDSETAKWLTEIKPVLADKLARVSLIEPRQTEEVDDAATLDAFLKAHLDGLNVKPGTRMNLTWPAATWSNSSATKAAGRDHARRCRRWRRWLGSQR